MSFEVMYDAVNDRPIVSAPNKNTFTNNTRRSYATVSHLLEYSQLPEATIYTEIYHYAASDPVFLSTHADRQGVDISFAVRLFVCVCVFVCLLVRLRIKLAASNFARWFIMGVLGRESPILGNLAPPEAQNRTNLPPTRE